MTPVINKFIDSTLVLALLFLVEDTRCWQRRKTQQCTLSRATPEKNHHKWPGVMGLWEKGYPRQKVDPFQPLIGNSIQILGITFHFMFIWVSNWGFRLILWQELQTFAPLHFIIKTQSLIPFNILPAIQYKHSFIQNVVLSTKYFLFQHFPSSKKVNCQFYQSHQCYWKIWFDSFYAVVTWLPLKEVQVLIWEYEFKVNTRQMK